jgi:hypothetical protein
MSELLLQIFVCVRARDGRPTLVQVTRKFACTNWCGSGRVQNFTFVKGRFGSGPKKVTHRQL